LYVPGVADAVHALERLIPHQGGPLRSAREQAWQALTLLSVPAPPRLVVAAHAAFFAVTSVDSGELARLVRRDEQACRGGPGARPYHVCPALTADDLAPVRGLMALSAWPLERRIVGPLSRRVNLLIAAARLAERATLAPGASRAATALLRGLAAEIPGAPEEFDVLRPARLAELARSQLAACAEADAAHRAAGALRALHRLSEADQLYGRASG
jgi:hypothetical protein